MICCYCDCKREATEGINGHPFCSIHHEMLLKIPVVDKVRGHVSEYKGEEEDEES